MDTIYRVNRDYLNTRIDRWVRKNICKVPQGLIEKNLRNQNITVNKLKVKSSYKLKSDDEIIIRNFSPKGRVVSQKKKYIPEKTEISDSSKFFIENNENFVIVNKPSGLAVQGGTKSSKNLIDIISHNHFFSCKKPFLVHRIDKDTSGILIIAKNKSYAQLFTTLFRIRKIHKTYLSICSGQISNQKGKFISTLIRYEKNKKVNEKAITNYKILDKNSLATLILVNPVTGRKHQIRKQLSSAGHPIFGDIKYNFSEFKSNMKNRLMLHSYSIKFIINDEKHEYKVNVPEYFKNMLKAKRLTLPKNFQKIFD